MLGIGGTGSFSPRCAHARRSPGPDGDSGHAFPISVECLWVGNRFSLALWQILICDRLALGTGGDAFSSEPIETRNCAVAEMGKSGRVRVVRV